MPAKPDAFLSYTRFDDRKGKISEFCRELSDAVREVSGRPFDIFQDVDDEKGIGLGRKWKDVLDEMLDQARFFIPIITQSFFNSGPCRDELAKFLDLESKTGRQDLVLPIYWITCPVLEEGHLKAEDKLAQLIDERHRWDWRKLRHRAFSDAEVAEQLEVLGSQIERARRNVLRVIETSKEVVTSGKPRPSTKLTPKLKTVPPQPKPAPSSQQQKPFETFKDIDAPWCPEMVMIPAGTFLMGSPEGEKGRLDNEGPQHEVTITHSFALGRYPVTFEEYDHFCNENDRKKVTDGNWGRGRRPVIGISHGDAEAYCVWLSKVTEASYRLPTEAEWEYACRAGTSTRYAFGNQITEQQANFGSNLGKTSEVGAYLANSWKLHDMHGNLREWCADSAREYKKVSAINPMETAGTDRVLRGGSWDLGSKDLRSAWRYVLPQDVSFIVQGFRCARAQVSDAT